MIACKLSQHLQDGHSYDFQYHHVRNLTSFPQYQRTGAHQGKWVGMNVLLQRRLVLAELKRCHHFLLSNGLTISLLIRYPSCRHTTIAALVSNPSLHTVPQCPSAHSSSRPSVMLTLPTSRTAPLSLQISTQFSRNKILICQPSSLTT